jgi:hypothetical protein
MFKEGLPLSFNSLLLRISRCLIDFLASDGMKMPIIISLIYLCGVKPIIYGGRKKVIIYV